MFDVSMMILALSYLYYKMLDSLCFTFPYHGTLKLLANNGGLPAGAMDLSLGDNSHLASCVLV